MKALILGIALALVASPALASKNSERHKHLHQLHKEHKVVQQWMSESESACIHAGENFHGCYIGHLNELRAKNPKMSPETEESLNKLTNPRRKK